MPQGREERQMQQLTFGDAEHQGKRKRTRREIFLAEMDQVVPWEALLAVIAPHYPKMGNRGRQPYPLETMLRVHLMQQWYALSDPAMEEALYEIASLRQFARLSLLADIPDETTILNFRRLLEQNQLAEKIFYSVNKHLAKHRKVLRSGTIVDATIINAPSSTKNSSGERDPEMHQARKGNQWFFGMKAHIGADTHTGLVHTVVCTAANVADVTQTHRLLRGTDRTVHGDSGYTGAEKREENAHRRVDWHIAEKPSVRRARPAGEYRELCERLEHLKAKMRAKVEHPFRVIKRQFGYVKVRYRGLAKNAAQVMTLFALSNLWMMRRTLLTNAGEVRL
jgi:IS5 family transposase